MYLWHAGGHSSLVIKVTDSWLACHEFELGAAKDPPCRGGGCTSNLPGLKRSPVDAKRNLGGEGANSGVILSSLEHGSKLRGPSPIVLVFL
ncbi:hypothetical protein TNCV_1605111 [Trichonephila clavipes]|nr:hypothetical protein TNCV_1605111 [Trichonephila clavipes]